MSAIRLTTPSRPLTQPRSISRVTNAVRTKRHSKAIVRMVIVGVIAIQIVKLLLDIALSQSAYELSNLKLEKIDLTTQSQILGQQVDSLSSQQNLANSAQALGMIANANPVFLRIADQKVFGKPKSALNTSDRVAKNNIASAVLIKESNLTALTEPKNSANVVSSKTSSQTVTLTDGKIPASPTH